MVTEDLSLPIESNLLEIVALILLSKNGRSLFPEVWFPTYLNNQDAVFKGDYHLPTPLAAHASTLRVVEIPWLIT